MLGPHRRLVEYRRDQPRLAEAPDDEQKSDQRDDGIDALPSPLAHRRQPLLAPLRRQDAHRMDAQKHNQSDNKRQHCGLRFDG